MVDSDNPMANLVVSRDSSVRNKLNLHHAARSAVWLPSHLTDLSATCRLRTFLSLPNLTLSVCCYSLPSQSLSCTSENHQPRSNISLARSRHLVALVASFIIHATCKLYSYSGGNYGVLEPEAS